MLSEYVRVWYTVNFSKTMHFELKISSLNRGLEINRNKKIANKQKTWKV